MTTMTGAKANEAIGADQFTQEVAAHVTPLRRGLRQLLTELGEPRTPTQLKQQLGVGYTICWQLFQVVRDDDESADTQHVPSLVALKRLTQAAQKTGVTTNTTKTVLATAESLHNFIRQHAEDRDYFDSMVAGANPPSSNGHVVSLPRRRAAYRANSHIWGSQNDLWLVSNLVKRSQDDPTKYDSLILSRQQGLRRLRADATVYLMAMKLNHSRPEADSGQDDPLTNALVPEAAAETGMPLIPAYSTSPLPQVSCRTTSTGRRLFNWNDDAVGLQSACDIVTGTINRSMPMVVEPNQKPQVLVTSTVRNKASALLVLDLIVHRPSFPGVEVSSLVHEAMAETCPLEEAQAGHQFALAEGLRELGPADVVNLAEYPRYRHLLQFAADQVNWNLAEFDVYRLHVPYPIMNAVHRMYFFDHA